MLLFGLPLFVLYTPTHGRLLATTPKILRLLALLGLALSALSIAIMTASMAGVGGLAELLPWARKWGCSAGCSGRLSARAGTAEWRKGGTVSISWEPPLGRSGRGIRPKI